MDERDIGKRFAETLVAQMLQRSGHDFERPAGLPSGASPDLVVYDGERMVMLEVKYFERDTGVREQIVRWKKLYERKEHASTESNAAERHLVVVTGRGDKVYADKVVAPLLSGDMRTDISIVN